jgi:hypothetical protein
VRRYDVLAVTAGDVLGPQGIVYNAAHQIMDDTGLMFVLADDLDEFGLLTKPPEPLIIRANAGDCLKINLTNMLPDRGFVPDRPLSDAPMPEITKLNVNDFQTDNLVGVTIDMALADAKNDGSVVGYNPDNLVHMGETGTFTYYCGDLVYNDVTKEFVPTPIAYGVCGIRSFGDIIKQGAQGLVGALVVEPEGSVWSSATGAVATITAPDSSGTPPMFSDSVFKEFVLIQQDGLNLAQGSPGNAIPDVGDDPEDAGEKAFNYGTSPFWARMGGAFMDPDAMNDEDQANVLSGADPATPVFQANVGDRVVFRLAQPAGRARAHTFVLHGHNWLNEPQNEFSQVLGQQTVHTVGTTWNLWLLEGAGGADGVPGDYLFREAASYQFSQGLWGIFRVQ